MPPPDLCSDVECEHKHELKEWGRNGNMTERTVHDGGGALARTIDTTINYMLEEKTKFRGCRGHEDGRAARPRCRSPDGTTTNPPYLHGELRSKLEGRCSTMLRTSLPIWTSGEHGPAAHVECRRRTSARCSLSFGFPFSSSNLSGEIRSIVRLQSRGGIKDVLPAEALKRKISRKKGLTGRNRKQNET